MRSASGESLGFATLAAYYAPRNSPNKCARALPHCERGTEICQAVVCPAGDGQRTLISKVVGMREAARATEATAGIEPAMKVLQTSALPLGYVADERGSGASLLADDRARRATERSDGRLGAENVYQSPATTQSLTRNMS